MTDSKKVLTAENSEPEKSADVVPSSKPNPSSTVKTKQPKTSTRPAMNTVTPDKISKTALFALLLSLFAIAGIGGMYYWYTQQQVVLEQSLIQQNAQALEKNQAQIKQLLSQQQQNVEQQLKQTAVDIQATSAEKIAQLENTITRLSQSNPSDWLTHEAEYLIRIAARTMWLERDTKAAIGLLNDAQARLKELNDPKFLPVRQLIHQDIAALRLMPVLETEDVILKLMALNKQIASLKLAMVYIPEINQTSENFELSESAADWRDNLSKTWQKFLKDFITVSRRTANVEPLMSPQHQQNLRENLSLKIQLTQWAASQENTELYQQTLVEIQLWLTDYYDPKNTFNQEFQNNIKALEKQLTSYNYPSSLDSLQMMRSLITTDKTTNFDFVPQSSKEVKIEKEPDVSQKTPPRENEPKGNPIELEKNNDTSEAI